MRPLHSHSWQGNETTTQPATTQSWLAGERDHYTASWQGNETTASRGTRPLHSQLAGERDHYTASWQGNETTTQPAGRRTRPTQPAGRGTRPLHSWQGNETTTQPAGRGTRPLHSQLAGERDHYTASWPGEQDHYTASCLLTKQTARQAGQMACLVSIEILTLHYVHITMYPYYKYTLLSTHKTILSVYLSQSFEAVLGSMGCCNSSLIGRKSLWEKRNFRLVNRLVC